jgi:hypothetical protein
MAHAGIRFWGTQLFGAHDHTPLLELGALPLTLLALAALAVIWTIWKAVHYTLEPGETEAGHIKRSILRDEASLDVTVSSDGGAASAGGARGGGA